MDAEQQAERLVKTGRLPEWCEQRRLPDWLPCGAMDYITGAIARADSLKEQKSVKAILPAFCKRDMEQIWKKIAGLSDHAASGYAMAIASCEYHFHLLKGIENETRQHSDIIGKAKEHAFELYDTLRKAQRAKVTGIEQLEFKQLELIKSHIETMESKHNDAIKSLKNPLFSWWPYQGWITRKKSDKNNDALCIFFIRSLSDVIRAYSETRALHREIAETVNVIFGTTKYDANKVKALVGTRPEKVKIRGK